MNDVWKNKTTNAASAKAHTDKMQGMYAGHIKESISASKIYSPDSVITPVVVPNNIPNIDVWEADTVSAAKTVPDIYKVGILNFASYKHPGGMFIEGSIAQEECLCHASNLYNILIAFNEYYEWNNKHLNKALYLNRAIYTPAVIFEGSPATSLFDVVTCAAPNYGPGLKYGSVSADENHEVLKSRIEFVLDIMSENNVEIPVLGAYGCGVFKQDPYEVANIFKNLLGTKGYVFKKVIFAIPGGNNLIAFRKVFANE